MTDQSRNPTSEAAGRVPRTRRAKTAGAGAPSTVAPATVPSSAAAPVLLPAPAPAPAPARFPIVGLGASAGGLEALEQFFRVMPADSGMGFVVVQHLDPSHASILSEILQRSTTMVVVEAQDRMPVAPDRVHVIPPNRDMVICHGVLQLSLPSEPRGQRMPIDAFLRSLADDQGEAAAGIVLSGTGTDGTLGLRAISGAGGLCLVQEPSTARYDGMPASAIHAGCASQVLGIEKMPLALRTGTRPLPIRQAITQNITQTVTPAGALVAQGGPGRILALLRTGTGHDFSLYKKSTVGRRIERRMAQHNIEDVEVYARFLKEHPAELKALFRELLINVTSFFRDPQAFVVLKNDIVPGLLEGKPATQVLRVWVAGCATGEEAYSVAIVLREVMADAHPSMKVQLYATDLDDEAIAVARAGLYPPHIAQDVSPERLRRFFNREEAGYRVRKEIREMVVFAEQSVIKDPPFTRLDLLACRNLMIYLEPDLQNRLVPAFHYALKPGGVLMLSPSESIGNHIELFEPIDRKCKFYRARPTAASTRALLSSGLSWAGDSTAAVAPEVARRVREPQLAEITRRALLQAFAPAAVMTDLKGNILYVHGETGRFLRPAPGHPTHSVVEMAREGLQLELRETLMRVVSEGLPLLERDLAVRSDGDSQVIRLSVRPISDADNSQSLLLVSFQAQGGVATPGQARRPRGAAKAEVLRVEALERELARAKEGVQAMLEEQQASNEELKSANEELQSTNEELQSTNEELETSKEELQSVNEEMMNVNAELQIKIEQMACMQDDMKNLLDNIRLGTIFLDRHLHIRRFTREAVRVYRLVPTDVGRPLADIRSEVEADDLLADAAQVLDTLVPVERELRSTRGTWYLARIQPYRTVDNVIDGVVMTFTDVTERIAAIAVRKARDLAEAIVDTVHDPLIVLDGKHRVVSVNQAYHRAFGGSRDTTVGQGLYTLGAGQWDLPALHTLLEQDLPREGGLERRPIELAAAGQPPRTLRFSARRLPGQTDAAELVLLVIEGAGGGRGGQELPDPAVATGQAD
ncbi:two-component system CheB/CheR fusion protein [Sphaerotilus hippei]|uniref:protein-glutamate O-methyltransferase n=1 Tax=Sphaerotilus hippei TaxID=744406 RepID=A0A318H9W6_9BURK|nr:two-component system CheB/CheR fusion protein [Sphaerotilus hippei]